MHELTPMQRQPTTIAIITMFSIQSPTELSFLGDLESLTVLFITLELNLKTCEIDIFIEIIFASFTLVNKLYLLYCVVNTVTKYNWHGKNYWFIETSGI